MPPDVSVLVTTAVSAEYRRENYLRATAYLEKPIDPENLLKSSGRGIFLIRNFMDDVQLQRAPEGGMEIRMVKRMPAAGEADGQAQA